MIKRLPLQQLEDGEFHSGTQIIAFLESRFTVGKILLKRKTVYTDKFIIRRDIPGLSTLSTQQDTILARPDRRSYDMLTPS